MSRIYTKETHSHISLSRGTVTYLTRVPEAITIMADMYSGPKYQKDIVKNTNLQGYRVQSIISHLLSRGMLTKSRANKTAQIYFYELTTIAKLWMLQHYPNILPTVTHETQKTGVVV